MSAGPITDLVLEAEGELELRKKGMFRRKAWVCLSDA